ncbi:MAG: SDR family NAD(P)-dependent oxidoreductase, partial [Pseudomonadota bacterium]
MTKTVLVTGATDGIGLETAKLLVAAGHDVLAHGRSLAKLDAAREILSTGPGHVRVFQADLSRLDDVGMLAESVAEATGHVDALINNAGVF